MTRTKEVELSVPSRDALGLPGTLRTNSGDPQDVAILVHGGGGVDRHEDGFYDRFVDVLTRASVATVSFDNRAYLATLDEALEVTIAGLANDIGAYVDVVHEKFPKAVIHVVAASFGGGAAAIAVADSPIAIGSLVLMNPLLDYRQRLLTEKPFWQAGRLSDEAAAELSREGFLRHGSALRMGRALINEVSRLSIETVLERVRTPTLILHGTADSRISHEQSVRLSSYIGSATVSLVEGADHGFAISSDEDYSHPTTLLWHERVFGEAARWIRSYGNTER